ncbi:MAG: single-stranded DNA-binding protein [Oscillospiraceae bacterium]|nr:single-stranded DNA-binding protein [Oscillospiraceae bacterium]
MDENRVNNSVELTGVLGGRPQLSHVSRDEVYYLFPLDVSRLSSATDTINVMARLDLLEQVELEPASKVTVRGELRSFNNKSGRGSRLVITVFARQIALTEEADKNVVTLSGVLCKPPNLRRTPMGREICDLMLATARRYGRSDYLPCISWGQNATEAGAWPVGAAVELSGRVQSRSYIKQTAGAALEKTAYEVSIVTQRLVPDSGYTGIN